MGTYVTQSALSSSRPFKKEEDRYNNALCGWGLGILIVHRSVEVLHSSLYSDAACVFQASTQRLPNGWRLLRGRLAGHHTDQSGPALCCYRSRQKETECKPSSHLTSLKQFYDIDLIAWFTPHIICFTNGSVCWIWDVLHVIHLIAPPLSVLCCRSHADHGHSAPPGQVLSSQEANHRRRRGPHLAVPQGPVRVFATHE